MKENQMNRVRVLLVTSWDTPCGIAEHSKLLKENVEAADPEIEILPAADALDPSWVFSDRRLSRLDLIHLNHHDGLHSRWGVAHVRELTTARIPVLVTYHDSRATLAECPKLEALATVASSVVVHEPVEGLKAIYWRQGVPAAAQQLADYTPNWGHYGWLDGADYLHAKTWKAYPQQPVLGSVGFNFPWKQFDGLCEVTRDAGWALVLVSHDATEEAEQRWRSINSSILVIRKFLPQETVVNYLAGCHATAFMYSCANTGTSAAIRQGIAARRPVYALGSCRQFNDLRGHETDRYIRWVQDLSTLQYRLGVDDFPNPDPGMIHVAHLDSWEGQGRNYAGLYRWLIRA